MRILGIGDTLDLGSMYLHLLERGHEVRVFVGDPAARDTLAGLVPMVDDWRAQLAWVGRAREGGGAAGSASQRGPGGAGDGAGSGDGEGFIVFETAAHGPLQESLRADGFQVIGGSAYGDRLENDRDFGQAAMAEAGMSVAPTRAFETFADAIAFVRAHPRRYVYKPSGAGFASGRTFVGQLESGGDMCAYLALQARSWPADEPTRLVLMDRLDGVEVGVGAYFNGTRFLQPACIDWEHKRFFPGDLGELTGEMGTLVSYRRSGRLFAETLGRMEGALRGGGYCGYINLNTIVDEEGVHPLEFTCRFGYPGFAILQALQSCGWDALFRLLVAGVRRKQAAADQPVLAASAGANLPREDDFATQDGFAIGVVLTVPPFPYASGYDQLSKGLPVSFHADLTERDRLHLHFAEVARDQDGHLVTSGKIGYIMVVTGCGTSVTLARQDAYRRVAKVSLVNARYRLDIGEKFIASDEQQLQRLGWL